MSKWLGQRLALSGMTLEILEDQGGQWLVRNLTTGQTLSMAKSTLDRAVRLGQAERMQTPETGTETGTGHLFAYGTLMCTDIMREVTGHSATCQPGTLADHQRLQLRGQDYPAIVSAQGEQVQGCLYRDLNHTAWQRLDAFEGEIYQRVSVPVTLSSGEHTQAQTYRLRPEFHPLLDHKPWDYAQFLAEGKRRFQASYQGYQGLQEGPPKAR